MDKLLKLVCTKCFLPLHVLTFTLHLMRLGLRPASKVILSHFPPRVEHRQDPQFNVLNILFGHRLGRSPALRR